MTEESYTTIATGTLITDMERRLNRRLDQQDSVLERVRESLPNFATKQDMQGLTTEVTELSGRVDKLEEKDTVRRSVATHKGKVWKIVGTVGGILIALGTTIGTLLVAVH